jgi:UDP-N-acetylenolpyruvoylglucosamine reductase
MEIYCNLPIAGNIGGLTLQNARIAGVLTKVLCEFADMARTRGQQLLTHVAVRGCRVGYCMHVANKVALMRRFTSVIAIK